MQDKQVALVTGANRGIGYELVKQLASMGFKVILTSRDPRNGSEAAQQLAESGLDVSSVVMDVTDQESIRLAAMTITETVGRIDVLINNAGVYLDGNAKILTMDPAILEKTMSTNFFGVYHVMRSFIPLMEKRGYGRIINVSSEYGAMSAMSSEGAGAYKISKLAMNALTQLAVAEVRGDIKVFAVDPGWVSSDMGGPSAPGTPKRAAELILQLSTMSSEGPRVGFFRDGKPIDW
jgi:NAD(P)-dependent dehydrogenase (short-subunit alcohol dehydrogenase family)